MASWHIDTLYNALIQRGWSIAPRPQDEGFDTWCLTRGQHACELIFDAHDTMGRPLAQLRESFGCQIRIPGGPSLYFYKKKSPKWPPALRAFVESLDAL